MIDTKFTQENTKFQQPHVVSLLVVGASLAAAGCSAGVDPAEEMSDQVSQAVCASGTFYGSDTLKPAVQTVSIAPTYPTYLGTGSGVGEQGLLGSGACGPNQQVVAPMSRDLGSSLSCKAGTDDLKSKRVAIDGILVTTATTNAATDVTAAELGRLFCAGGAGAAPTPCSLPQTLAGGQQISRVYRRDDASGTTDTFLSILNGAVGCSSLCDDANHVIVTDTSHPTDCPSLTATQCIGRLTRDNVGAGGNFALGYAGLSALTINPDPKVLTVSSVDPVASSFANVRNFSYLFSRYVYANYNRSALHNGAFATSSTSVQANEKAFLCEFVLGPSDPDCAGHPDSRQVFENALVGADFLACDVTPPLVPLNCNPNGPTPPGPVSCP